MLAEIERLKRLTARRTVKQAFKDAYNKFCNIMFYPNDWDGFDKFTVFFTGILAGVTLIGLYIWAITLTKGLLAIPLLAYPVWVLFRKEE